MEDKGLHGKYRIEKTDGTPVDPEAMYFVLRLDTDAAARSAAWTYVERIEKSDPQFASELSKYIITAADKNRNGR
jgi:hypothetical protein